MTKEFPLPAKPKARFLGCLFYFDIEDHKQKHYNAIELSDFVKLFGGKVTPFFSKEVTHYVTTRESARLPASRRATLPRTNSFQASGHWPESPAPATPGTPGGLDFDISNAPSPQSEASSIASTQSSLSSSSSSSRLTSSASRTSVRLSTATRQGADDRLEIAMRWHMQIYHADKIKEYLMKYKRLYQVPAQQQLKDCLAREKQIQSSANGGQGMTDFYTFKYPYILLEDANDLYGPLYKEFAPTKDAKLPAHPILALSQSPARHVPYAVPSPSLKEYDDSHKPKKRSFRDVILPEHFSCDISRYGKLGPSVGYCEVCTEKFTDILQHVKSSRHTAAANSSDNFRELDQLLANITWRTPHCTSRSLTDSEGTEEVYLTPYEEDAIKSGFVEAESPSAISCQEQFIEQKEDEEKEEEKQKEEEDSDKENTESTRNTRAPRSLKENHRPRVKKEETHPSSPSQENCPPADAHALAASLDSQQTAKRRVLAPATSSSCVSSSILATSPSRRQPSRAWTSQKDNGCHDNDEEDPASIKMTPTKRSLGKRKSSELEIDVRREDRSPTKTPVDRQVTPTRKSVRQTKTKGEQPDDAETHSDRERCDESHIVTPTAASLSSAQRGQEGRLAATHRAQHDHSVTPTAVSVALARDSGRVLETFTPVAHKMTSSSPYKATPGRTTPVRKPLGLLPVQVNNNVPVSHAKSGSGRKVTMVVEGPPGENDDAENDERREIDVIGCVGSVMASSIETRMALHETRVDL